MQYAPIALFTYSRADHTRQAVESLLQNAEAKDSDLYIFSDGPKTEEKRAAVEENRKYIHTITGFKSVTIVEREKNWGLANSLIAGITEIVNKYDRVIVVEDDLILSPYFLKFMNEALEKYKDEDRIGAIDAYVPSLQGNWPETFFLTFFHPWGWATWKRSWMLLNTDTKYLLRKLRFKARKFDFCAGAYGNLYCHKVGLVNSWYVHFYASLFLAQKLILFPGHTLVKNVGLDNSGTHCGPPLAKQVVGEPSTIEIKEFTDIIRVNERATNLYVTFNQSLSPKLSKFKTYYVALKSFIRRLIYWDCR